MRPFAYLVFDGGRLSADPHAPGRRLRIDPRCLADPPIEDAFAHVCALPHREAALRFDEPEVQQARRDALEWWIPMLADELVCVSTFAVDASLYGGAVTVARSPARFDQDPFARLFPGTVVRTSLFSPAAPPPGPVVERYNGMPWPGGGFGAG